jgi:hypothetical protein
MQLISIRQAYPGASYSWAQEKMWRLWAQGNMAKKQRETC